MSPVFHIYKVMMDLRLYVQNINVFNSYQEILHDCMF